MRMVELGKHVSALAVLMTGLGACGPSEETPTPSAAAPAAAPVAAPTTGAEAPISTDVIEGIRLEVANLAVLPDGKITANITVHNDSGGNLPAFPTALRSAKFSWRYVRDGETLAIDKKWDTRVSLTQPAPAGASVVQAVTLTPPTEAGVFTLQVSMVQEAVVWFHDKGMKPASSTVKVLRDASGSVTLAGS